MNINIILVPQHRKKSFHIIEEHIKVIDKKNKIIIVENSLDKVSKLSGYEFDWNDKQEIYQGHDVGVIAQEVEEILPEVVTTRDSGYKAVKYEKLVPLLIESIKELKEEINGLKTKLGEYDG